MKKTVLYVLCFLLLLSATHVHFNDFNAHKRTPPQLLITEVYFNPHGDPDTEFIEIYNPTSHDINLDYYFISYDERNERLDGIIHSKETKRFHPKFSLPNSGWYIVLSRCGYQKDYVNWENIWKIEADRGDVISRKKYDRANCEDEWI